MFRGILITQDNADKVRISTLSPEFGWLRPAEESIMFKKTCLTLAVLALGAVASSRSRSWQT